MTQPIRRVVMGRESCRFASTARGGVDDSLDGLREMGGELAARQPGAEAEGNSL